MLLLSFILSLFFQTRNNAVFFYLSTYLFVFQLTSQKVVDHIVRTEKKMFFISSSLLILSFFFQTRKKINANLFISNCMPQVSVFDKTNITLNKY